MKILRNVIIILLCSAIIGGVCALGIMTGGFKDWSKFGQKDDVAEQLEPVGGVYDGDGNLLDNTQTHQMPERLIFASTAAESSNSSIMVSAFVTPQYATNKNVSWSLEWFDGNGHFYDYGVDAQDYIMLSPNGLDCEIKCLHPFGSKIKVTVQTEENSEISASCTIDYSARISLKSIHIGSFIWGIPDASGVFDRNLGVITELEPYDVDYDVTNSIPGIMFNKPLPFNSSSQYKRVAGYMIYHADKYFSTVLDEEKVSGTVQGSFSYSDAFVNRCKSINGVFSPRVYSLSDTGYARMDVSDGVDFIHYFVVSEDMDFYLDNSFLYKMTTASNTGSGISKDTILDIIGNATLQSYSVPNMVFDISFCGERYSVGYNIAFPVDSVSLNTSNDAF